MGLFSGNGGLTNAFQSIAATVANLAGQVVTSARFVSSPDATAAAPQFELGGHSGNGLYFDTGTGAATFSVLGVARWQYGSGGLSPFANGGQALGAAGVRWSNLFLTGTMRSIDATLDTGTITFSGFSDGSGTPGNATNNNPRGVNAIAGAASTCVVTNSFVSATSLVLCSLQTNDGTATGIKSVIPAAGSFTITVNAAATGTTKFGFVVFN